MRDQDLINRLRLLRRTVETLETDLRRRHLNERSLGEVDSQMENGIASDPRCADLGKRVDALRESVLTPRQQLFQDAVRACWELKDAIEGIVSSMV